MVFRPGGNALPRRRNMGCNEELAPKSLIVSRLMRVDRALWAQRAAKEAWGLSGHPPLTGVAAFGWMNSRLCMYDLTSSVEGQ